jgi:hypothetical protein
MTTREIRTTSETVREYMAGTVNNLLAQIAEIEMDIALDKIALKSIKKSLQCAHESLLALDGRFTIDVSKLSEAEIESLRSFPDECNLRES